MTHKPAAALASSARIVKAFCRYRKILHIFHIKGAAGTLGMNCAELAISPPPKRLSSRFANGAERRINGVRCSAALPPPPPARWRTRKARSQREVYICARVAAVFFPAPPPRNKCAAAARFAAARRLGRCRSPAPPPRFAPDPRPPPPPPDHICTCAAQVFVLVRRPCSRGLQT